MEFFKNKTLYTFVAALVSLSLVAYSFGFNLVQAAEVSTLPADIDITVSYDADNVNWTYNGRDYSFSRDFPLVFFYDDSELFYNAANPRYLYDYKGFVSALPFTSEADNSGYLCRASYWFSPSENALYIVRDDDRVTSTYYSGVRSYGVSNGHGSFFMVGGSKTVDFCVLRYDFNDDTFIYGRDNYLYGNHSFNAFKYYDFNSGIVLKDSANYDTYTSLDDTELTCYLPTDLLCIFSNYEISGFYEPDTSKVNTPDYYFNYQYIFYLDGKGYTFIDSAQPLTEVTAQSSYAYLTFADACNKYIYTSIDGITWDIKTTVDNMYGVNYLRLDYSWLYKKSVVGYVNQYDAELVYTNDDKFGVSIKEWQSLYDVIANLPDFHGSDYSDGFSWSDFPVDEISVDILSDWDAAVAVSKIVSGILKRDIDSMNSGFKTLTFGDLKGNDVYLTNTTYSILLQSLLSDEINQVIYEDGVGFSYTTASIRSLIKGIHSLTQDSNTLLSILHNDFSGMNDNLFLLYDLDSKLLSAVKDIKIPDYSNVLSDISAKLDKLPASGSSAFVPFDDAAILDRFDTANDYLKDIKGLGTSSLLTNILTLLTGTDGEGIKVTINPNFKLNIDNDLKASFSAKIDKLFDEIFKINASLDKIAEFNFGTGSDTDYSTMLSLINDNVFNVSGRLYDTNLSLDRILQAIEDIDLTVSFPELEPKNDLFYDDPDSDEDLIDFVSEYAKTALDKSYFASFLTFDSDTMSAIRFYNGLSEDTFEALGPLGAALLVSVGFTLVGAAVRRHT